jgi:dihydrofolate reductase
MSLDGFIAGPDDSMDWAFGYGEATSLVDETMSRIGAILAGRRWYELAIERWDGVDGIYGGAYDGRVFVLTHRPPDDSADPRISFISDGIEAAVATAEAAAGDKDVGIFGASLSRQCLQAGLLAIRPSPSPRYSATPPPSSTRGQMDHDLIGGAVDRSPVPCREAATGLRLASF